MSSAMIYKIDKKGLLIHANAKAVSGFDVASEPFIQLSENSTNETIVTSSIKEALKNDDNIRVPDPKDWNEFHKDFLKKAGLKSLKVLDKSTTLCCVITSGNGQIIFTPTKHSEKPDRGFSHMSIENEIVVSYLSPDSEIHEALELALKKCE